MSETRTARQELAYIERRLFKGAGLDKASRLEGEERRTYKLAQVERLLTEKHGYTPMAVYERSAQNASERAAHSGRLSPASAEREIQRLLGVSHQW